MRNILVLMHDDEWQESRLQAALAVTRALSGHLTCIDVLLPPLITADPWSGYAGTTLMETAVANDSALREKIKSRLSREDVSWNIVETIGEPSAELRRAADLADLIVVTSHGNPDTAVDELAVAGVVATKAKRPVLAVPPDIDGLDLSGRALVAWDGSDEASAALRAAVPLLALAEEVVVLTVNGEGTGFAGEEAATYLSRHGIVPRVLERSTADGIANIILEEARTGEFTLIVMGAFGQSRLREAVFGGVTRSVLKKSRVPVLIAH